MRFLLIFFSLFLLSFGARAVSFDCAVAEHPIEKLICAEDELSKLDEELTERFSRLQDFVIKGDTYLINRQRYRRDEIFGKCALAAEAVTCLKESFNQEIELLKNRPAAILLSAEGKSFVRVREPLLGYDFGLRLNKPVACEEDEPCLTSGELAIYIKQHKNAHQVFELPLAVFSLYQEPDAPEGSCGLLDRNSTSRDPQGCAILFMDDEVTSESLAAMFQIADYNFDGFSDFAFHLGASYAFVFVYDPQDKLFYYAPALSTLFDYSNVGVDEMGQELQSSRQTEAESDEHYYRVENNMPVMVRRFLHYRDGNDLVKREDVGMGSYAQTIKEERIPYWREEAPVARINCLSAEHPVERAVCGSDELLQLEERLTDRLRELKNSTIEGDTSLIDAQHQWQDAMYKKCPLELVDIGFCVRDHYQERIYQLLDYPSIPPFVTGAKPYLRLEDKLPDYDFGLTIDEGDGCRNVYAECTGHGKITLYEKGKKHVHQMIEMRDFAFVLDEDSRAIGCGQVFFDGCGNIFPIYSEEGEFTQESLRNMIEIGDYNFDGFSDFVVHKRDSGGDLHHWIFLYNPQDKLFHYAPALSELFLGSLSLEINEQDQQLEIFYKSGCCQHVIITFRVEHNMPVPAYRFSHALTVGEEGEEIVDLDEIWQDGVWQLLKEERERIEDDE